MDADRQHHHDGHRLLVAHSPFVARFLLAVALALALNAHADITGKAIAVADGDTITVLHDRTTIKVRLTEIDARESKQVFGQRSKKSLSDLCFNKTATLATQGKDRYGRTLACVTCAGVDANAEQVRRGMAWVYDKYVTDRGLYTLQDEARLANRRLWAHPEPVPPWEWRKGAK